MNSNMSDNNAKMVLQPPNKLPGLKLNFKPPPSLLRKLANNEPIQNTNVPRVRTLSNNDNKSYDELLKDVRPMDIAKRLNFVHLNDLPEPESPKKEIKKITSAMDVDENSDVDDSPIDLVHCIIPLEERKKLLEMDKERKLNKPPPPIKEINSEQCFKTNPDDDNLTVRSYKSTSSVPPVNEMKDLSIAPTIRSRSPPRPRLPCLFDDYEYFVDEQRQQRTRYRQKLKTQKMSGIAKVICYKIPQFPVPKIDFALLSPPPPHIKAFKFDTPSPDELYLANLEKNKDKKKKPMFLVP